MSGTLLVNLAVASGAACVAAALLASLGPVGLRLFPWLFERVAALRSRELFLLAVVAVALGTAYLAAQLGLLGAFVPGVVAGESDLLLQILDEEETARGRDAGGGARAAQNSR